MKNTIGIDEVGRGPIAGPVAVGAFVFRERVRISDSKLPLRDSKKLTKLQRDAWYTQIVSWQKEGVCDFSVVMLSAKAIDKQGIVASIQGALSKALQNIQAHSSQTILLDGGLRAPDIFPKQKTIIKGDEKEIAIALASIVAKVTRDRHMHRLSKKYPGYGFEAHVGYGTRAHYAAIHAKGITPVHRLSFLKNLR